jgi:DNA-binding protein HU-beta
MKTFDDIKAELHESGKSVAYGFGTYELVSRAARKGRNPHTGEAIEIPAKQYVKFHTSPALNAEFNQKGL